MNWRGAASPRDRIFSCLVYLLPLLDMILLVGGVVGGSSFLGPVLTWITLPLLPLILIYTAGGGMVSFGIFLLVYMLVVRNDNIPHFIRFNAMQSILVGIVLSLFGLTWRYVLGPTLGGLGAGLLVETLFNTIFLGTLAVVVYSVVQSALGRYAEIPTLSDAAYSQVRY